MRQIRRCINSNSVHLDAGEDDKPVFKGHCYILISIAKKFEWKSIYQVIIIIAWFSCPRFRGYFIIYYSICPKKYGFDRIDKANFRLVLGDGDLPIPIFNKWSWPTIGYSVDKCDFTFIYWWVVKHHIPLEMNLYCVHRGHSFPVGNKTLHTLKGIYVVGTLKFGDYPISG